MKAKRHSAIMELISNYDIQTQEELTKMLRQAGFDVTQSTVSRDIRELSLMKIPIAGKGGKQKYNVLIPAEGASGKLVRVFQEAVVSIDSAQNIIVLKTMPGMAMAVAAALDAMSFAHIMGSIAGDDTIFCVTRTTEQAERLLRKLKHLQESKEES